MSLSSYLAAFMDERKITAEQIANRLGVSKQAIYHWRSGIRKPRGVSQYKQLAELMGVDYTELLDDGIETPPLLPLSTINKETPKIGILSMVAGFGAEGLIDPNFEIIAEMPMPTEFIGRVSPKYARAIRCLGESMEPQFENGDWLLIEMLGGRSFIKRGGIYLVRVGDVVYIKRCEFLPDGDVKLISINPAYGVFCPGRDYGLDYEVLAAVYGRIRVELGAGFQFDNQGIK